jgi:hypothetical protein
MATRIAVDARCAFFEPRLMCQERFRTRSPRHLRRLSISRQEGTRGHRIGHSSDARREGAPAKLFESGAPCRTRTCDLLVRSERKGGNRGQRDTAAPCFLRKPHNSGQPPKAASRYRLSVICQSARIWPRSRRSQIATDKRIDTRARAPNVRATKRYSSNSASRSRLPWTTRSTTTSLPSMRYSTR